MFRTIGIVLSWLPTVVAVVTTLEQLMGSGTGAEKKELALLAIYRVLGKAGIELNQSLKTILSAVIDAIVAVLNLLGVSGFADSEEQGTTELLPAVHVQEVEALDAKVEAALSTTSTADAKAYPNDGRLDELEALLTDE